MNNWQLLPKELQLRDWKLQSLTLQETEALFEKAREMCVVDLFAELFWEAMNRVRCDAKRSQVDNCVAFLEERKRTLGRVYDIEQSPVAKKFFAIRYNECELAIQWLVQQYECYRKSKPYFLEVKYYED